MCRSVVAKPPKVDYPRTATCWATVLNFLCTPDCHIGLTLTNHSKGCLVLATSLGDQAHKCGLRRGDVVTHYNGMKLPGHETAIEALQAARTHSIPVLINVCRPNRLENRLENVVKTLKRNFVCVLR